MSVKQSFYELKQRVDESEIPFHCFEMPFHLNEIASHCNKMAFQPNENKDKGSSFLCFV